MAENKSNKEKQVSSRVFSLRSDSNKARAAKKEMIQKLMTEDKENKGGSDARDTDRDK